MKNFILGLCLIMNGAIANAQNGLENIIIEKYYVSNAADAAGSVGTLPVGSVTYRIYVDMLPNYKFQAAYGVPVHEFRFETSTSFFNNEDRGATTPNAIGNNRLPDNTVMLDSWLSVGAASAGNFGILKTEDNGISNIVNVDGILQNNDPAVGVPLTTQDGVIAGTPQAVTFVGLTTPQLDVFDATSQFGNLFTTSNGSVASLNGSFGPTASNKILIAQMTTDGCFSFKLNIQIGTPTGGIQQYVAENPTGNEISIPSLIYNLPAINISANLSGFICSGTSVTFTAVPINGGTSPSYQWKKNGINVGTNNPVYTTTSLADNDQITSTLTSNATLCVSGIVTSSAFVAHVNPTPTATITPTGPTTFCLGTNPLTLTANNGTGLTYQWKKGTANIAGATNISYAPTASSTYKVLVTNANGCTKLSPGVVVTVNALPTATITHTGPTTFCSGTTPLTLTANSGTGLTYQWRKGTTDIGGATNISYMPTASGTYKVTVTNAGGCTKISATGVVVTVNPLPAATITAPGPLTFCAGDSVVLQANAGAGLIYQWKKGTTILSGATLQTYTAKTAGAYKVVVTNANTCSKASAAKTITVNCKTAIDIGNQSGMEISIYPNPSDGPFVVNLSNEEIADGIAHIELINVLGQNVYNNTTAFSNGELNQKIDLGNNAAKGLYLVRIELNGVVYNSRLILH